MYAGLAKLVEFAVALGSLKVFDVDRASPVVPLTVAVVGQDADFPIVPVALVSN